MTDYSYQLRTEKTGKIFDSEVELKEAYSEVCEPDTHVWKSTWVFGVYDCRNCEARKTVK